MVSVSAKPSSMLAKTTCVSTASRALCERNKFELAVVCRACPSAIFERLKYRWAGVVIRRDEFKFFLSGKLCWQSTDGFGRLIHFCQTTRSCSSGAYIAGNLLPKAVFILLDDISPHVSSPASDAFSAIPTCHKSHVTCHIPSLPANLFAIRSHLVVPSQT